MDNEELNILEKIEGFINDFDPTNKGSVIILSIGICMLLVPFLKSIYGTSVEEVFMNSKKKSKKIFFKLLALLLIFTPANLILSIDDSFGILEFILGFGGLIVYIVYDIKELLTKKYSENISELTSYYKEKRSCIFLFSIISIMPGFAIVMNKLPDNNIPQFNCVVIISVIEIVMLSVSLPELVKGTAKNYLLSNGNKLYIYEMIDDESVLCGDNPEISKSKKYITINYEDLKKREILHMQYESLSKARKKELREIYRKNKRNKFGERKQTNTDK